MSVVLFDHVSKRFALHRERSRSFQESFLRLAHRRPSEKAEEFWALRDLTFEVQPGEMLGLIGSNGAGKSTVLKLISRILEPTSGTIEVNGRLGALLELGTGMHPDLTGRENIYLNGAFVGFSRREIRRRIDEIISFSEMERFIDVPVKHYSSGMHLRLGFAIAIQLEPELLLVDEVLSVGDEAFRLRCIDKIQALKRQGVPILFVTHDLDSVRSLCTRAIWLDHGSPRAEGVVDYVLSAYLTHARARDGEALTKTEAAVHEGRPGEGGRPSDGCSEPVDEPESAWRWGTREGEIVGVQLMDDKRQDQRSFKTGDPFIVRIRFVAHERIERPHFGLALYRADGFQINGPNTSFAGYEIGAIEGPGTIEYIVDGLPLLEGSYLVSVSLYDYDGLHAYDHHHQAYGFRVYQDESRQERYGTVMIPSRWQMLSGGGDA